jgi:hypothetical protein
MKYQKEMLAKKWEWIEQIIILEMITKIVEVTLIKLRTITTMKLIVEV